MINTYSIFRKKSKNLRAGFALPTVVIASIIMLSVLLVSVTSTTVIRVALVTQSYTQLAQNAADAGIAYANACLAANGGTPLWSDGKPLKPNTDCSGNQLPNFSCTAGSTDSRCSVSVNGSTARVLVVGGGGGSGGASSGNYSGGGGGGGVIYNDVVLSPRSYTVVVGSGGDAGATGGGTGVNGGLSSFGVELISDGGGGGGGNSAGAGSSGGSGGGGSASGIGGQGTVGQGTSGGTAQAANVSGGGGGGAGGAGGNGSGGTGGAAGDGISNSISGAAVYYGGGGAARGSADGSAGSHGGTEVNKTGSESPGAPNRGAGGGGVTGGAAGKVGGSGVVIVSYLTGSLSASGGSMTTSGGYTIHTFTSVGNSSFTITSVNSGNNGGIAISSFSVGRPTINANNIVTMINSSGTTKLLRPSNSTVWRTYPAFSHYTPSNIGARACPPNFIRVPGSSTYQTTNFCVMKYEAKQAASTTPVSKAAGTPWVSIDQPTAMIYSTNVEGCTDAGSTVNRCHLITENEWLTIAQNVLGVASNWSSGVVGTGYIYRGHSDSNPNSSAAADTNDGNGYYGTGNVAPSNQRRTLTLSNGEVIWDLSGNVAEWTSGQAMSGIPGGAGMAWREWNVAAYAAPTPRISPDPFPSTAYAGASGWDDTTNGIGKICSDSTPTVVWGFARGGTYNGYGAGIFGMNLDGTPDNVNVGIGFRVAKY